MQLNKITHLVQVEDVGFDHELGNPNDLKGEYKSVVFERFKSQSRNKHYNVSKKTFSAHPHSKTKKAKTLFLFHYKSHP